MRPRTRLKGRAQLAALALLHAPGQDFGHQIGDLFGQLFCSELHLVGSGAEV
jgi:hypothetical protein